MTGDVPPLPAGSLEAAARDLCQRHGLSPRPARELSVWRRVGSLEEWLERARVACADPPPDATKAAEWLLDNDYRVQRAIPQIREDLPEGFYRRLPGLAEGSAAGPPRVFAIAHGLLRASRMQLSLAAAERFVGAYQEGAPLTIAELWALPTMLRLACLERIVTSLARLVPGLEAPFVPTPLAVAPDPSDDTECVARGLANLGTISSIPWKDFFDRTSVVESILRADPADVHRRMDFATRDRYRAVVEELTQGIGVAEAVVAQRVVEAARGAAGAAPKAQHVGYWLIGAGRGELERSLGYRVPLRKACARWLRRRAAPLYAGAVLAATAAALALPAFHLLALGAGPAVWALGMAVALLPASVVGTTLVQWAATRIVPPRVLPKLDFGRGIARDCRAAVVVPVLVRSADEVAALLERLAAHYLANPDPALAFVLLTDHADAEVEHAPGDEAVIDALMSGVGRLNDQHGAGGRRPFHLLHRPRRFNPSQGCWMGWERKRGKLEELNALLCDGRADGFSIREGDVHGLTGIRFVVTVDADTLLPPGSVARLVGTLAHPLNRAEFDEATGRVRAGYTVIQPRVEIAPEDGSRSLFARLCAGDTAIDIYTRAVSDVYQDLMGVGIYVGKGVYEVEGFQRSLAGRVPENALASHDLFEGVHGRVALASDIVLFEGFPATYADYARRWHRWLRGDWALLPWLGPRVPGPGGSRLPNRLSRLERWMILDNLRRSLLPASLVALLLAGWLVLPGSPWLWTSLAVAAPGAYLFSDLVTGIARVGGWRRTAVRSLQRDLLDHAGRWLLCVIFLVQDARVSLDAIGRTLWRVFMSRRRLLEWTPATHAVADRHEWGPRATSWRELWLPPTLALALAGALAALAPAALASAAPLLLLWLAAPELAVRLCRPRAHRRVRLAEDERAFLRRIARRTWLFFETFAGPEEHWLAPDNFQEDPGAEVAHRTSPTNVGMLLLSSLSACDLGYLGPAELEARLRNSLDTLARLPRHRGHLLNWYDTRSLEPLEPRYVSTVDSGNLAVSLLATKEGCRELADGPAVRQASWDGLEDGLGLLAQSLDALSLAERRDLDRHLARMAEQVVAARRDPAGWQRALAQFLERDCPAFDRLLQKAVASSGSPSPETLREIRIWLERVHHHLRGMQRDLARLLPWLGALEDPPRGCEGLAGEIAGLLPATLPLPEVTGAVSRARARLGESGCAANGSDDATVWSSALDEALAAGERAARELHAGLLAVAERAEAQAWQMDFRLLYDEESRLFHIGYNVNVDRLDPHHYDLLATEARLASFFAIAKRDVPFEHWFYLERPIARAHGGVALLSWGGSMFEYLMPPLVLRSHPDTLLGQSERSAAEAHERYARQLGIPWGISESAFASLSPERHYRYRAFGVPGLGLRRGLSRDAVVAPYASALAIAARPRSAVANLRVLEDLGLVGTYGFFEAADFTPARVPEGRRFRAVRAYMAHHQGMILAALANALFDDVLVRRFHSDPRIRAIELLLAERVPRELPPQVVRPQEHEGPEPRRRSAAAPVSWTPPARGAFPQLNAIGNGRLSSWVSESGGGGLVWHGQALTRWSPDATLDERGLWLYLRDEANGAVWSVTRQPTGAPALESHALFHSHLAEFHRRDHGIATGTEIGVAPGDDVEIRRVTLVNESDVPRSLLLTSYGEAVLAPARDDERHPAFSKLFVHAEHLPSLDALLLSRRPRRPEDRPPLILHRVVSVDPCARVVAFDADRESFLGRNGSARLPRGVVEGLGGRVGWTLDPILALQVRVELEPQQRCQVAFLTMAAGSRESLLELAERHATPAALQWALSDAASEASRELERLGLDPVRLPQLQALASLLLQPHPALRARADVLSANRLGPSRLWGLGISGDLPILLLRVRDARDTDLLRVLVRAQQLWRWRGIHVDLVVLRAGVSGYAEPLRERLFEVLHESGAQELVGRTGGVHLVFGDQIGDEERVLVEAAARVVLDDAAGPLERQLADVDAMPSDPASFEPAVLPGSQEATPPLPRPEGLRFDNGFGGFCEDGREYVIHLEPGESTPAPWSNVLANEELGSVVTESGMGFTWAGNSGENRLTPWWGDPVADPPGESIYLRDEETGAVWTPTPRPAGDDTASRIRHGAGYTEWQRRSHDLEQRLRVFVPAEGPVKLAELSLQNLSRRPRRITVTYYAEWLLGALPSVSREHVVCEYDPALGAILARNPWTPDFGERLAFLASSAPVHGITTDRREFLGREGDLRRPAGLGRWGLSGRVAVGADPCAALQIHLDVPAAGSAEAVFALGQARDLAHVRALAPRWRDAGRVREAWQELGRCWDERLGAVAVETPDAAFDLMANRWLTYQAIASRILARAGFYQAGGAIGFRDQLQDHLALVHADPARLRRHILTCAGHQFEEGDVLHWWHPPSGRGVRTRCSDDLLWLPYAAAHYVDATGDVSILDEEVRFLRAPPLAPDEHDRYHAYDSAPDARSLFEHCERALERGVTRGDHALPLIGTGDWNDGMDRVGDRGRGESVWLGWFAIATMRAFAGLCDRRGEAELARRWRARSHELHHAVERNGWDGRWYVRAFDDDGRPWGSRACDECRIDSISQSWSVLAGAGDPPRAREAVESAERELVRAGDGLVRLLWPPFDATPRDPGYIRAYPPGIRENGGQYTHAAVWLGWAFAELGDRERAARVLGILDPIRRTASREGALRHRVEPYVLAADVGSVEPHVGRGGWTWYTGSAAWAWRFAVERILGLRRREGGLVVDPCLPPGWEGFRARIRGAAGFLELRVADPDRLGRGVAEIRVDGRRQDAAEIAFPTDGSTRRVDVRLGALEAASDSGGPERPGPAEATGPGEGGTQCST